MTKRNAIAMVVIFYLNVIGVGFVYAMSSTNFQINWDSMNSGGIDVATSTNYYLRDTIGEQATGEGSSETYLLGAGYRTSDSEDESISFSLGTQENETQTAYSLFNSVQNTIVVNSTTSYSAGDLIGVIENQGLAQIIAIGKITAISGATMTVDVWDGAGSLSSTPSGGDDFVYRLGGYSAELGILSVNTGKTSLTATRVTSNAPNGYSVMVHDDGDLRTSSSAIMDVSDGSVSAQSEEYGWRVYGTRATSTGLDYAFTTSTQSIQFSTTTASIEERVGLIYKASISPNTPSGNYSHKVYYTMTPNF